MNCMICSFDTEEKLWEVRAPLPFSADKYSAIEMNGLLYVSGIEYNSLQMWSYAPEQNLWTEHAHIRTRNENDIETIVLSKMKERLCLYNHQIGFYMYDIGHDRWTKV